MPHDYKSDRERLEAELDERQEAIRAPLTGHSKALFDCFRSADINDQIRALARLGATYEVLARRSVCRLLLYAVSLVSRRKTLCIGGIS